MATRTATMLFLDAGGTPIGVVNAQADVFYFNTSGQRVWVLPSNYAMTPTPNVTGRYSVSFEWPVGASSVYATMYGTDPATELPIVKEQTLLVR